MIICKKCLEEIEIVDYGFTKLFFCGYCGFLKRKDILDVNSLDLNKLRKKRELNEGLENN